MALLIAALVGYLILVLRTHDMVYIGDITGQNGSQTFVTRIYTTDISANEALSEIVATMNNTTEDSVPVEELTQILATYQDIIYAPVFTLNIEQLDESTYILTGSVYNGLNDKGESADTDYGYKELGLIASVSEGKVVAAENVYPPTEAELKGNVEFVERKSVVDPVITDEGAGAAFAFKSCDSFRLIFTETGTQPATVSIVYTYDVVADNPFDFTGVDSGTLYITATVNYNDDGILEPIYKLERGLVYVEE